MTTPLYDDSNWREDYKQYTSNKKHLELLENGPRVFLNHGFYRHCIMNGKR